MVVLLVGAKSRYLKDEGLQYMEQVYSEYAMQILGGENWEYNRNGMRLRVYTLEIVKATMNLFE